jgi:hypothetical protein
MYVLAASAWVSACSAGTPVSIQLKPGVPPQPAFIGIEGAEINAASGGEIDELGVVKVLSSGRYTLSLHNLAPTARVTATVFLLGRKGGKDIAQLRELEVVEAPRREQAVRAD